ncbi:hypothetical protein GCM10027598_72410 [Amycolatopsis oliviviridis]
MCPAHLPEKPAEVFVQPLRERADRRIRHLAHASARSSAEKIVSTAEGPCFDVAIGISGAESAGVFLSALRKAQATRSG